MLQKKCVVVNANESCDSVYRLISKNSSSVEFPGMAIITNDNNSLAGVVTDGDFRRGYIKNRDFSEKISQIMNSQPFWLTREQLENHPQEIYKTWTKKYKKNVEFVLILDEKKNVQDIFAINKINGSVGKEPPKIALIGMGFVGVTLAAHILNEGEKVIAIDQNISVLEDLRKGFVGHVHEPGLEPILKAAVENKRLKCSENIEDCNADIYIISVGTPVDESGNVNTLPIENACKAIGACLQIGSHVMLRSTVPVGTSRNVVIPILEQESNLKAGADFHISFAPERTAEGAALVELKSLPQIVGSLSSNCQEKALSFWNKICPSVVSMDNLEAAELVKLANNTFRDVSFAFANELALLADRYNVNAFELIAAANDGYPRNNISKPSPGVGGYCLTKDPLLYHSSLRNNTNEVTFGSHSRDINNTAKYFPKKTLIDFCNHFNLDLKASKVLIMGMAFKGDPETNDLRGSTSVELYKDLSHLVDYISIFDWMVNLDILRGICTNIVQKLDEEINDFDAIIIMNNHKKNVEIENFLTETGNRLIFDGWSQLNKAVIQQYKNTQYATLGYSTFRK